MAHSTSASAAIFSASAEDVTPADVITWVRSPRVRPSINVMPSRAPIADAACRPGVAPALVAADSVLARALNLTMTRPASADSAFAGDAVLTWRYSVTTPIAATAAVAATTRLTAPSSRLMRAIALSEML